MAETKVEPMVEKTVAYWAEQKAVLKAVSSAERLAASRAELMAVHWAASTAASLAERLVVRWAVLMVERSVEH